MCFWTGRRKLAPCLGSENCEPLSISTAFGCGRLPPKVQGSHFFRHLKGVCYCHVLDKVKQLQEEHAGITRDPASFCLFFGLQLPGLPTWGPASPILAQLHQLPVQSRGWQCMNSLVSCWDKTSCRPTWDPEASATPDLGPVQLQSPDSLPPALWWPFPEPGAAVLS